MNRNGFHHLTLSVTNADASAQWYQGLLGPATVILREGPGWRRVRMQWDDGLVIGATEHDGTAAADTFDHTRVGLDHIGIGCPTEGDVRAWAQRIDSLGYERGPVEDVPYGWAVTARDPDGIAVEFFCGKQA